MTIYHPVDKNSLDFSNAPAFRKIAVRPIEKVEIVTSPMKLSTVIKGVIESEDVECLPGDRIVTGENGERYRVSQESFDKVWELDPANATQYRSKSRVVGLLADQNASFEAPEGWGTDKPIRLDAGGIIAFNQSTNQIYGIAESALEAEWGRLGKDGIVFAKVTSDLKQLEQDLSIAEQLGEHIHAVDIERRILLAQHREADKDWGSR